MAPLLLVGARGQQRRRGVVNPDERQHQPGRFVRRELLIQDDLLGDRHSAAPLPRPVRHGVARAVQFGEPILLEPNEFLVAGPGLTRTPVRGDVRFAP
jgi:hypothetical protein